MEGNWSEFGLAGMVIGALFVCLYFVFQSFMAKFSLVVTMFNETVKGEADAHRQERADWYAAHHANHSSMQETLRELTEAIKNRKI